MTTERDVLQVVREEGARAMLDALISLRVVSLDLPNQAVMVGRSVGMELLDRELLMRGIRRG